MPRTGLEYLDTKQVKQAELNKGNGIITVLGEFRNGIEGRNKVFKKV